MIKRNSLRIMLFTLLWVTLPVSSQITAATQATEGVKIGYVNIRKILAQAPQIQQIQSKLAKAFESEREKIVALRNEIATLNNRYDELVATNAAEHQSELQLLRKSVEDKQLSLTTLQQRMQDAYNLRRNESLARLQTLVVNMVGQVSKAKGLDIVLNNTGVIYVNARIDITPDVFKSLAEQSID